MTNRRNFLKGSIAAVLGAVGLGGANATDASDREFYGGETAPTGCDQCQKLRNFNARIKSERVPNTEYERQRLKEIVDPEYHSWEGDCLYSEVKPTFNQDIDCPELTKEDVQEMDYDIHVSHSPSVVNIGVTFDPKTPLRVVESTVTVGGTDD